MHDEGVSVIVPVYNGARHLAAALESILAQESRPREIIVVDDGSTDATPSVVNRFSDVIHPIRQDNLGPSAARNIGIEHATAPLIAFLDADDVWLPTALIHQLAALKTNLAAAIAWGPSTRVVDADARPPQDDWHGRPQWALSVGSMLFKRSVFDDAGRFDPALRIGEDLDLMIRITEHKIPIVRHAHVVCEKRIHAGNISRDGAAADRAHFIAIGKAFERRRLNTESKKTQST
jgi:glycosyltransferase involved in cell wall biosynthesis